MLHVRGGKKKALPVRRRVEMMLVITFREWQRDTQGAV